MPTGAMVALLLKVTDHLLVRYEAHSTGETLCLILYTWSKASPRRQSTITWLNDHIVKLTFKYLCLNPYICIVFNLDQRSFFLEWAAVNENNKITGQSAKCR